MYYKESNVLSPKDLLILSLLFKILVHLKPKDFKIYEYYLDIITHGLESKHQQLFESIDNIFHPVSEGVIDEVKSIIQMFQHIEHSLNQLDKCSKDKLASLYILEFGGFHPLESSIQHYIYLNFYMKHYAYESDINPNNILSIDEYRQMLHQYQQFMDAIILTASEINQICSVQHQLQRI